MRYDTVIFDLDGTLTNSHDGITNAVRYALSKMNLPIPDEAGLRKYIGPPLVDSFQRYAGMDAATAERGALLFREYYVPTGRFENQVYPGIRELLKALHDGGARVLIATGKPEETSWLILRHFGLDGYIDGLSGPSDSTSTAEKGELIARVLRGISAAAISRARIRRALTASPWAMALARRTNCRARSPHISRQRSKRCLQCCWASCPSGTAILSPWRAWTAAEKPPSPTR